MSETSLPPESLQTKTPIKMRVRETIILRVVGKALVPFMLLFALLGAVDD